jgi:lysozyme
MKTSPKGIQLIQQFESCALKSYPDPKTGAAPWTCGWGATGIDITPSTKWTQYQADTRLLQDLAEREEAVMDAVRVPLRQGQFDAMVSIVFNVGAGSVRRDGIIRLKSGQPSTLLRKLNAGDYAGASAEFEKWISPGSNVTAGLLRRRKSERALFDAVVMA